MGQRAPKPTSPTTLFRQRRAQQQPLPPHASQQRALLMPLSATTGTLQQQQQRLALPSSSSAVAAAAAGGAYHPPPRRSLRSRPQDVDEIGRRPGQVSLPGLSSARGGINSAARRPEAGGLKRRKVGSDTPKAGPSRRRPIPPPPPAAEGEEDEDAELASEYNCPVCLCPPTQAVVTPCGHMMCYACLQKTLAANLIRTQQRPPGSAGGQPLFRAIDASPPPINLEGECPVCRVALPGGLLGTVDKNGRIKGEGVRRIEVKLVDVRPVGPPIELE